MMDALALLGTIGMGVGACGFVWTLLRSLPDGHWDEQ